MIKVVDVPETLVIGLAERTSNDREMSGQGLIGKTWERFLAENIYAQIPNKSEQKVLGVYADYAGDHTGEYTFLAGAPVSTLDDIPAGLTGKRIPAGRYAMLTSDRGPLVPMVIGAWQKIWMATPSELGGERAFRADFEVYDDRARDRSDAQLDIYVGLK